MAQRRKERGSEVRWWEQRGAITCIRPGHINRRRERNLNCGRFCQLGVTCLPARIWGNEVRIPSTLMIATMMCSRVALYANFRQTSRRRRRRWPGLSEMSFWCSRLRYAERVRARPLRNQFTGVVNRRYRPPDKTGRYRRPVTWPTSKLGTLWAFTHRWTHFI